MDVWLWFDPIYLMRSSRRSLARSLPRLQIGWSGSQLSLRVGQNRSVIGYVNHPTHMYIPIASICRLRPTESLHSWPPPPPHARGSDVRHRCCIPVRGVTAADATVARLLDNDGLSPSGHLGVPHLSATTEDHPQQWQHPPQGPTPSGEPMIANRCHNSQAWFQVTCRAA